MSTTDSARSEFRRLHTDGLFVMPNAWDAAVAKVWAHQGVQAIASTSSGFAATIGRTDYAVSLEQLVEHASLLVGAVDVPINLDSERCYGPDAAGVRDAAEQLAATGAAGFSIEDYDPETEVIDPIDVSIERVAAAAAVADAHGMVLTARAERHLYESEPDFNDTLERLTRFADVGAGCIYAPGLTDPEQIRAVCGIGPPVNVLISTRTPTVPELAALGVRRVSTGGALIRVALGEARRAVEELMGPGTLDYMGAALRGPVLDDLLD